MTTCIRSCIRVKPPFLIRNNVSKVRNIGGTFKYATLANSKLVENQNHLFSEEKKRQIEDVGRIEKIIVKVLGPPEDVTLYMNQNISTPYDCTRHISHELSHRAALALVDSEINWDMHRPLTKSCDLKFLTFLDEDPSSVNIAFWESCSIILGAVISNAFKDDISVTLHSYPPPDISLGSFAYDVLLPLNNWIPTVSELRILSAEMVTFYNNNYNFERLSVNREMALKIMEGNPYKKEQILTKAPGKEDKVTLYRIGRHIDLSNGPLISTTSLIGRCTVTSVHKVNSSFGSIYRFQGIALPRQLMLNHFAYGILEKRARNLNRGVIPTVHPEGSIGLIS